MSCLCFPCDLTERYWMADNSTTSGNSYLRLCDSQTDALAQLLSEASQHGSEPLSLTVSNCDPDGSYAPKQCQSNQCNCMTKANELIPPFATDRYSPAEEGQNCCNTFDWSFSCFVPPISIHSTRLFRQIQWLLWLFHQFLVTELLNSTNSTQWIG